MKIEIKEYVSGGAAAVTNIALTFPLNKTSFRQMVHGTSITYVIRQLYNEGIIRLYRGSLPILGQQAIARGIMFGNYALFTRQIKQTLPNMNSSTVLTSAAFMAGCTEALLTPFERVQVLLQDSKQHENYRNTTDALRKLNLRYGVSEFFRGTTAIIFRNGTSNVAFFYAKQLSKDHIPVYNEIQGNSKNDTRYKAICADFLTGAVIGAGVSTLFYPVNVVKTHMQLKVGGSFLKFRSVITQVLRERGIRGLWHGVHVNYSRSFLSWGVINSTYEFVNDWLR